MILGDRAASAAPPAPEPPEVSAVASVSSRIGATPPTLTLVVTNTTSQVLRVAKTKEPRCWLPLYVTGRLLKSDGTPVAEIKRCKAVRSETLELAPSATLTIEVPLAQLFKKLPRGSYQLDVALDATGARTADGSGLAWRQPLPSFMFTVAKLVSTFTIERGRPAPLAKGVTLTFTGHGHKHTMEGDPPSPLLIAAQLATAGTTTEVSASVQTEDHAPFQLGPHTFDLVEYAYDERMTLRYWGTVRTN